MKEPRGFIQGDEADFDDIIFTPLGTIHKESHDSSRFAIMLLECLSKPRLRSQKRLKLLDMRISQERNRILSGRKT
jgi:hypothetical protein